MPTYDHRIDRYPYFTCNQDNINPPQFIVYVDNMGGPESLEEKPLRQFGEASCKASLKLELDRTSWPEISTPARSERLRYWMRESHSPGLPMAQSRNHLCTNPQTGFFVLPEFRTRRTRRRQLKLPWETISQEAVNGRLYHPKTLCISPRPLSPC
jgi:hypothetical protein